MTPALEQLLISMQLNERRDEEQQRLYEKLRNARTALPATILESTMQQVNTMLPQAKERYGEKHANYLFYVDLLLICAWCARYMGIAEESKLKISNLILERTILREQNTQLTRELDRYATAEEIMLSGTLDTYMHATIARLGKSLPDHPRVQAFKEALEKI